MFTTKELSQWLQSRLPPIITDMLSEVSLISIILDLTRVLPQRPTQTSSLAGISTKCAPARMIDRKTHSYDFKHGIGMGSFAVSNSAESNFIRLTQTSTDHKVQ
jgi:hypothetical protein